jgi:hypothetical protein
MAAIWPEPVSGKEPPMNVIADILANTEDGPFWWEHGLIGRSSVFFAFYCSQILHPVIYPIKSGYVNWKNSINSILKSFYSRKSRKGNRNRQGFALGSISGIY